MTARAELATTRAELVTTRAELATVRERVVDLEAKLKESSRNSDKPPSSDPPWVPRPSQEKPTGRKPGGQPGHKGVSKRSAPNRQEGRRRASRELCDSCLAQELEYVAPLLA